MPLLSSSCLRAQPLMLLQNGKTCFLLAQWTWASIILSTGTYVWFYGAGAHQLTNTAFLSSNRRPNLIVLNVCKGSTMWFGTGSGTLTVWTFCVVAIELKHRAPKAHTFLEIVKLRWGKASHLVFFFFAILCALLLYIYIYISIYLYIYVCVCVCAASTSLSHWA